LRRLAQRLSATLLPLAAAATFGASCALAAAPNLCDHGGQWTVTAARAPAAVTAYLDALGDDAFDQRAACARWAGTVSNRHQTAAKSPQSTHKVPPRLVMYPADGIAARDLIASLKATGYVREVEKSRNFVVVSFSKHMPTNRLKAIFNAPEVGYLEPDCDGPDYLTTSAELPPTVAGNSQCWQRAARATFPNDPCLDELWGHKKIGWDPAWWRCSIQVSTPIMKTSPGTSSCT
jgi:hypothetical protein